MMEDRKFIRAMGFYFLFLLVCAAFGASQVMVGLMLWLAYHLKLIGVCFFVFAVMLIIYSYLPVRRKSGNGM